MQQGGGLADSENTGGSEAISRIRFVKGFAKIAKPLTDVMPNPGKGKKKGKRSTEKKSSHSGSWTWGQEQEMAFVKLKECLVSPPVFGFPDYSKPLELHTDGSVWLWCVLYQNQDGRKE